MKMLTPNRYEADILECDIHHEAIINQRKNAVERHRCLNYTVRVFAPGEKEGRLLQGGIPLDKTRGNYAPIIRFFKQIGCFRDPDDFDEKEFEGRRVFVDTGVIFDKKLGLRPYVLRFYPAGQ